MGPIRLNGKLFTRTAVAVRLNGVDLLAGVDAINWSDERPTELVQGLNQGGIPLGKAEGNYTCSADISLYGDEGALFEKKLLLLDPTALGNVSRVNFQLMIQFREELRTRSVLLVNCNVKGQSSGVSNGGDAIVEQYTLQPLVIVRDGAALANLLPSV